MNIGGMGVFGKKIIQEFLGAEYGSRDPGFSSMYISSRSVLAVREEGVNLKMYRLKRHRYTDSSGGNRIKRYSRYNIQKLVRRSDKKTAKLFDIDEAIQLVTNCPIQ